MVAVSFRRPPDRLQRAAAVLGLVVLAGCAASRDPSILTLPAPGVRPVSRLGAIGGYRTALATVDDAVRRELGQPPFPVTFRFFGNSAAFEVELLKLGYPITLAHDAAATMAAIGGHRTVLLNDGVLSGLVWRDRVAILAHELAHTIQYELGGGDRGTSDQWLREGFAEWVAMRVLDRLGAMRAGAFRSQKIDDVRMRNRAAVPRLDQLLTFPDWVGFSGRGTALYAYAFVAVDFLIERHGTRAVLDYFRRFATVQDRIANFEHAFGETLPAFEAAFGARVEAR